MISWSSVDFLPVPGGFTGSTSQTTSTPQHPITHTGGVGDLPGTTSEVDVARLPEERGEHYCMK